MATIRSIGYLRSRHRAFTGNFFPLVFFFRHPYKYNGTNILALSGLNTCSLRSLPSFTCSFSMGVCGSDELANVCQHRWLFQVSISIRSEETSNARRKAVAAQVIHQTRCHSFDLNPPYPSPFTKGSFQKRNDLRYDRAMIQKRVLNDNVRDVMISYMTHG